MTPCKHPAHRHPSRFPSHRATYPHPHPPPSPSQPSYSYSYPRPSSRVTRPPHLPAFTRARLKLVLSSPATLWFLLGFGTACIITFAPGVQDHPEWRKALIRERMEEEEELMRGKGNPVPGGDTTWCERACLSNRLWRRPTRRHGRQWGDADPFVEDISSVGPRVC